MSPAAPAAGPLILLLWTLDPMPDSNFERGPVGRIVTRVVTDHLNERRRNGLVAIGGDEISYRRHHGVRARAQQRAVAPPTARHSATRAALGSSTSAARSGPRASRIVPR